MNNKITITEMMNAAKLLKEQGEKFTMLGIGPMSKPLLKATLELAQEKDFPIMLIASRNQVDSDEFGHGYVRSWDQDRFVADVYEVEKEIGFTGLCYLCRDHGGPWQRDEERNAKLPVDEAMERCVRSYKHDMEAGFDLLHIDPTKDPEFAMGTVPFELVISRTVDIIEELEKFRKEKGLPEIGYEAGTEETNGGLTSVDAFSSFIDELVARLAEKGIKAPEFVVGQTGTLTRLTENVGNFNRENAALLSSNAAKHGVGVKEHNGDYLSDKILLEHPVLGITAMNVAPEFGTVETRAYLELARVEERCVAAEKRSNIVAEMARDAVKSERWRKWVVGDTANATVEEVLKDKELTDQITDICGHYTYETPAVKAEIEKMLNNLKEVGVDGESYVNYQLKNSIDRYAYCFGMHGLTSKLLKVLGK
ncbi:MAG: class II D-tagatose-bisphosphate aldolase, non-catalytic subunit [Acutalibacteraceae bacterium]|nr:class II D-tagatose-bisphosphate aldolase, non-catalytic subunit [Acutalibacteraceae bacterium]